MGSNSEIIAEASEYVRHGLFEDWKRWITLIVFMIIQGITMSIIPLFNGYLVRVYANPASKAPETEGLGGLFVDGWKFNIITILYMIPAIIVALIFGILGFIPLVAGMISSGKMTEIGGILIGSIGLFIAVILFVVISLIMYMAYVHFARTGKFSDAFAIGEILSHISDGIGWGGYFLMWIIVWVFSLTLFVIIAGLSVIPFLGAVAAVILMPIWGVFIARIISDIYDNRI